MHNIIKALVLNLGPLHDNMYSIFLQETVLLQLFKQKEMSIIIKEDLGAARAGLLHLSVPLAWNKS